jgi:hypothetical protein
MNIVVFLAGLLFLLIIVMLIVSSHFGNKISFGESDFGSDAKLRGIADNPKRFKTSVYFALVEHAAIITLAVVLFTAFSSYSLILGFVWLSARTLEGLIVFNNEKNYWRLLALSKHYSDSSDAQKQSVSDVGRSILMDKERRFTYAQILFSIGTLAYTTLFVLYDVIPSIIGWFGLVAAAIYGVGNGIVMVKAKSKGLAGLGGLLVFLFELTLGVWLLYYSFLIPQFSRYSEPVGKFMS